MLNKSLDKDGIKSLAKSLYARSKIPIYYTQRSRQSASVQKVADFIIGLVANSPVLSLMGITYRQQRAECIMGVVGAIRISIELTKAYVIIVYEPIHMMRVIRISQTQRNQAKQDLSKKEMKVNSAETKPWAREQTVQDYEEEIRTLKELARYAHDW